MLKLYFMRTKFASITSRKWRFHPPARLCARAGLTGPCRALHAGSARRTQDVEASMRTETADLESVRAEASAALAAWDLAPDAWRLVGTLHGNLGSTLRPVVEVEGQRYVLRRQA